MPTQSNLSKETLQNLQQLGLALKSILLRIEDQGYRFLGGKLVAPIT